MRHSVPHPTRLLWGVMLLLFCVPLAGRGSDAQGNDVALGFGSESCQTFLQARSNGLDLPYRHWVTGYLTNNPGSYRGSRSVTVPGGEGVALLFCKRTLPPCLAR